jgi:hypothetical protein
VGNFNVFNVGQELALESVQQWCSEKRVLWVTRNLQESFDFGSDVVVLEM